MVSRLNIPVLKNGSRVRGSLTPSCKSPPRAQLGRSTAPPGPLVPVPSRERSPESERVTGIPLAKRVMPARFHPRAQRLYPKTCEGKLVIVAQDEIERDIEGRQRAAQIV